MENYLLNDLEIYYVQHYTRALSNNLSSHNKNLCKFFFFFFFYLKVHWILFIVFYYNRLNINITNTNKKKNPHNKFITNIIHTCNEQHCLKWRIIKWPAYNLLLLRHLFVDDFFNDLNIYTWPENRFDNLKKL